MQASTKLQKVRSPVDFMQTLHKSMSHAMRLKTSLPYESVVAFAYALRERCSAYNEIAGEVISLSDTDIKAQGLTATMDYRHWTICCQRLSKSASATTSERRQIR
eukprot:COSAG01_NODE_28090_length_669_cov_1.352632_2_plen_105_part_00